MSDASGLGEEIDEDKSEQYHSASDNNSIFGANDEENPAEARMKGVKSRKRRREWTDGDAWTRSNRWDYKKQFYNDKYVELLNETIQAIEFEPDGEDIITFADTQYGIMTWTSAEKAKLHWILPRRGRQDVKAIASAIGTKSEIEVVAYLKLLQERAAHQHLYQDELKTPALADFPAALEIHTVMDSILDEYAEALRLYQDQVDDMTGRRTHSEYWLIDQQIAQDLDKRSKEQEENLDEASALANPEVELFQLSNWVELSRKVFMNASGSMAEDNWRNVAFDGEEPALTMEAVLDFHNLVISLTRRLVQTVIILAQSRLRVTGRSNKAMQKLVRYVDVSAALQIHNMPFGGWEYWAEAPRRCHLDVRAKLPGKNKVSVIDNEEAEKLLSGTSYKASERRGSLFSSGQDSSDTADRAGSSDPLGTDTIASGSQSERTLDTDAAELRSNDESQDDTDSESSTDQSVLRNSENEQPDIRELAENDEADQASGSSSSLRDNDSVSTSDDARGDEMYRRLLTASRRARIDRREDLAHSFAQYEDIGQAREEWLRLSKRLGRSLPEHLKNPRQHEIMGSYPRGIRKAEQELVDWKDEVLKLSGWEEYGHGDSDSHYSKRIKKSVADSSESST